MTDPTTIDPKAVKLAKADAVKTAALGFLTDADVRGFIRTLAVMQRMVWAGKMAAEARGRHHHAEICSTRFDRLVQVQAQAEFMADMPEPFRKLAAGLGREMERCLDAAEAAAWPADPCGS